MKIKQLLTISFLLIALNAAAQSKVYFVSPSGDDNQTGLSIKAAWKTLDKVNQVIFQPGDKILFLAGGTWKGQLKPQGSGENGKPVIISSFGGDARPVINIGRSEGAGIRLTNQSWWEIRNMEITSGAPPEVGIGRQGIVAAVRGEDQHVSHIVVSNCRIHDIWGQLGGTTEYTGSGSCAILVRMQRQRNTNSTIDDVLIENNIIERFDKVGIIVEGAKKNVVIRGNVMDNLGGDGIIVGGTYKGLIEYNIVKRTCLRSGYREIPGDKNWWPHTAAIWLHNATETVIQFNEVYDTGREPRNGDGEAYDFDFGCKRCVLQYNYSKNNYGLLLIMYDAFENIARYNISENDKTHLLQLQCAISERNLIYNNVFYIDHGTADLDFFCGDDGKKDKASLGANFYNNIFYATGQGRFRTAYTSGFAWERQFNDSVSLPKTAGTLFHHNCYFGPWKNGLPDDAEKLVADPLFVAPGTGGEGLNTLKGYMLQPGSPCINTGRMVPLNGKREFFGNPLDDGSTDFGVYEQIGSGVSADQATENEINRKYLAESRLAWAKTTFPKSIKTPDKEGKVIITLREPLENQITGTISLSYGTQKPKPASILLNNTSLRNSFIFTVKPVTEKVTDAMVHVILKDQELSEEWDIPLSSVTQR